MSTTCQDVVDRAKAFSTLNTPLTSDRSEMLSRIRADQRAVFARVAKAAASRFQTVTTLTSTSGSGGRTVSLASVSPPVGRILRVYTTADQAVIRQADLGDEDGKFPPRYVARGLTLVEVEDDWGATGTVGITLAYVQGPTDIDPTGAYSQALSLPDEWCDLVVLPLAMYLHQKDPGRDPDEFQRLEAMYARRLEEFDIYCTDYTGTEPHAPDPDGRQIAA